MTRVQKIQRRQSELRSKMSTLLDMPEADRPETWAADLASAENELKATEPELRAALALEGDPGEGENTTCTEPDAEHRERLALRGRSSVARYLHASLRGRNVDGAEAELSAAVSAECAAAGGIPIELWERPETREAGVEHRAITPAPGTVGVNLDTLRPMVFAPSIVSRLGVDMPMVESGTYATGTITTAATADAVAKGSDVPETAGAFTVTTTTPKRVGASMNIAVEDVFAVGATNFEAILREHISLVLSDELDDQMLNGAGTNNDLTGIFQRLTDPSDPSAVATFDTFVGSFADGIDGLFASRTSEVSIVAGVDTYKHSAKTFRDIASTDLGDVSFADYAMGKFAGWWTNKRMPAADGSNFQAAIRVLRGRTGLRLAVCPTWGYLTVNDIYTGARKGQRRFVISAVVGDLILVQPSAYAQVAFQTA